MTDITPHDNIFSLIRKTLLVPVHPAGWPFIGAAGAVTFLSWAIAGDELISFVLTVITAWMVYFFRNPPRVTPQRDGLVISPADGVVQMIVKAPLPPELDDSADANTDGGADDGLFSTPEVTRISIFLNVFDIHVNRMPAAGTVTRAVYHPGKFLNASLDKASVENERSTVLLKLKDRKDSIAFVQIAGLVARRILCHAKATQEVAAGETYGIIRFGSRMDVYLPAGVNPLVCVGQKMTGGETVLADLDSTEPARIGATQG